MVEQKSSRLEYVQVAEGLARFIRDTESVYLNGVTFEANKFTEFKFWSFKFELSPLERIQAPYSVQQLMEIAGMNDKDRKLITTLELAEWESDSHRDIRLNFKEEKSGKELDLNSDHIRFSSQGGVYFKGVLFEGEAWLRAILQSRVIKGGDLPS